MTTGELMTIPEIGLTEIDGEPLARDIEIAERLGCSRPRKIRELIEANFAEIEGFGPAPRRGALVERPQGGRTEAEEYWLNEEQALLVAALSKAPHAAAVRAMLIRCFVAWRRGHLGPAAGEVAALTADVRKVVGGAVDVGSPGSSPAVARPAMGSSATTVRWSKAFRSGSAPSERDR